MPLVHRCIRSRRYVSTCCKTRNCMFVVISVTTAVLFWLHRPSALLIQPCRQEYLDPWDPSVMHYFRKLPHVGCSQRKQLVNVDIKGILRFNDSVLEKYELNKTLLQCSYSTMKRGPGDTTNVTFESPVPIILPVFVKSHMFRVTCVNSLKKTVYDFLHFNMAWNENAKNYHQIEDESADNPSVIIFGIDSVSRSHAIRSLPKAFQFLMSEFQMYDFEGYSKIGENTWRNFIPLLAGKSHRNYPLTMHMLFHTDSIPFIWYEKEMKNISTFYAEDRPEYSAFTVFGQLGFNRQPTDFYFRPFTKGVKTFEPYIVDQAKQTHDCYGPKTMFDTQIDYLKVYLQQYKNKRKFALSWNTQVSHSNFKSLSRVDEPFLDFLKWMKETNQTQNAIFVIMSDHGPRLGDASLTHVGRAECNKPWLMVHIPAKLKERHKWLHESLSSNTKLLTSHYDLYQTMIDLFQQKAFFKRKLAPVQNYLVRRNLFHGIPNDRTCADAGIEAQYCTCEQKAKIQTSSMMIQSMAKFLVEKINDVLSKYSYQCYTYNLHNVTRALVSYSAASEDFAKKVLGKYTSLLLSSFYRDNSGRYTIMFYAVPGYAYFEGTVDFAGYSSKENSDKMTLVGEPIRLDTYGNTSGCVQNPFHRPYCICKHLKST